jgi:uncharacterized protein YdbL (DUF1318 family)
MVNAVDIEAAKTQGITGRVAVGNLHAMPTAGKTRLWQAALIAPSRTDRTLSCAAYASA